MNRGIATELTSVSDEELMALVLRRQEAALGALYDRYSRLVYAVALRITGDRETTEEVVQDVFQNVWQAAASFQPGVGAFSSWLLGITRHRSIDVTLQQARARPRPRGDPGRHSPDRGRIERGPRGRPAHAARDCAHGA